MSDYTTDLKETTVTAISWTAYAGVLVGTLDPGKAEVVRDAIESLGGTVKEEDQGRDSIRSIVARHCHEAWNEVIEKNALPIKHSDEILSLKTVLCGYNFAVDPYNWDSFIIVQKHIANACRKKKVMLADVSNFSKKIARGVILELGRRMDDDPVLKIIDKLNEVILRLDRNNEIVPKVVNVSNSFTEGKKFISTEGVFNLAHPFPFQGRQADIDKVMSWIGIHKIILVRGEGGIGKTEFCREVLARLPLHYTAVNLIECHDFNQLIRRTAGALKIPVGADDSVDMIEDQVLAELNGVLYLDNFEDIISETKTEPKERRRAFEFLRRCLTHDSVTILISSRYKLDIDITIKELDLKTLDDDAATVLFTEIWGEGIEEDIKGFVKHKLHNYALTIVLVAKQRSYVSDFKELMEIWEKARVTGMGNPRHESLMTALNITYEEIKADEAARYLWELFTLFPDSVSIETTRKVISDSLKARRKLLNLGVVHMEKGMLSMQPTLREYIKKTEKYNEDIGAVVNELLDYYKSLYPVERKDIRGTDEDIKLVRQMPNAVFFMDQLVQMNDEKGIWEIHKKLRDYYNVCPYEAQFVLSRVADEIEFTDDYIVANIKEYCGNLEMRTDKLEEAGAHYREAEELYRKVHEDLGLANVLKSQGDLEMRTAKLEEAGVHYREAEELYRKIHADLGLANVLQSQGDLLQKQERYNDAIALYVGAVSLYEKTSDLMGFAYTTAELCCCFAAIKDMEEAMNYAEKSIKTCELLPYENVKAYCVRKIVKALHIPV